jgi:hypothetical protein
MCEACGKYLIDLWNDHTIALTQNGLHHPTKILKLDPPEFEPWVNDDD